MHKKFNSIDSYCSYNFGPLYLFGIPIFLSILIYKGVKEIDLFWHFDKKFQRLEEEKKQIKEQKNQNQNQDKTSQFNTIISRETRLKENEKKIEEQYSIEALGYTKASGSAYLYNSYTRKNKYEKIVGMIERVSYLLITSFVSKEWLVPLLDGVIMLCFFIIKLFQRPYISKGENLFAIIGRSVNIIVLIIGIILRYSNPSKTIREYILPFIHILISILFIAVFIFFVIYYWIQKKLYLDMEVDKKSSNDHPKEVIDQNDG